MSSKRTGDLENNQNQYSSGFLRSSSPKPLLATPEALPPVDVIIPHSEEGRINEFRGKARALQRVTIVISSDEDEDVLPTSKKKSSSSNNPFVEKTIKVSDKEVTRRKPLSNSGQGDKSRRPAPPVEYDSDVLCINDVETDSDVICLSDTGDSFLSTSPVKKNSTLRTPTRDAPICFDIPGSLDEAPALTDDPYEVVEFVPRRPLRGPVAAPATPSTSKSPKKPKRASSKQLELQAYARTLFADLNTAVFNNGLPETEIVWNVRLLTTAGRATRTKDKEQPTTFKLKIELAPKVVDSVERIRNTLSHEMCHLAVWVIDNDLHESQHGQRFRTWAARVAETRPDITISTRHSYGINYKFRWECEVCGEIFGRHSKSLNVDQHFCLRHDPPGQLKPLFEQRARRTSNTVSRSKMAADSPCSSPRRLEHPDKPSTKSTATTGICIDLMKEGNVDEMVKGFVTLSINEGK